MNAGARLLNNCYFILSFTGTITLMKIEQNGKMKKETSGGGSTGTKYPEPGQSWNR